MDVKLGNLEDNARKTSIEVLNASVAEGVALGRAIKQAHWNIKGQGFIGIHELFDQVKRRIDDNVDEMAERVQQLDGVALGTVEEAMKTSKLEAYPTDLVSVNDHVEAIVSRMRKYGGKLRAGITTTDEAGDPNTADILTTASNQADKDTWFISSFID